jgi:hypothetical protein
LVIEQPIGLETKFTCYAVCLNIAVTPFSIGKVILIQAMEALRVARA